MHIVSIFGIKNMFYVNSRVRSNSCTLTYSSHDMNEIDMQHVCSNSMVLNISNMTISISIIYTR